MYICIAIVAGKRLVRWFNESEAKLKRFWATENEDVRLHSLLFWVERACKLAPLYYKIFLVNSNTCLGIKSSGWCLCMMCFFLSGKWLYKIICRLTAPQQRRQAKERNPLYLKKKKSLSTSSTPLWTTKVASKYLSNFIVLTKKTKYEM